MVSVPLDWDEPQGKSIEVFVQRVLGTTGGERRQLWLLAGGPGQSAAGFDPVLGLLQDVDPSLDLYAFDHRGLGRSTPLECLGGQIDVGADDLAECIADLQNTWGPALAEFNTSNGARDLHHLIESTRDAQRQTPVFIRGISYGTTLAHRYLQLFPDHVDGVILDSPAAIVDHGSYDRDFNDAAKLMMTKYCTADQTCSDKLGNAPWAFIGNTLNRIDAGHCSALGLTSTALRRAMGNLFLDFNGRELIAPLIYRVARCSEADVAAIRHFASLLQQPDGASAEPDEYTRLLGINKLLFNNIETSEQWTGGCWRDCPPLDDADLITVDEAEEHFRSTYISLGFTASQRAVRNLWPRYKPDQYWRKLARTETPILTMVGELDGQTTLRLARPLRDHFRAPSQYYYELPSATHGLMSSAPTTDPGELHCGATLLLKFVHDPHTPPTDVEDPSSCVNRIREPSFTIAPEVSHHFFGTSRAYEGTPD